MVQRVEAALGVTLAQQANVVTGARPDAVAQPGQPDKTDPAQNPPPKEQEGSRRAQEQGGRQAGLAALARNNPEIAKLLAARNAPMTAYTASAPTTLGQAAKTILALLQHFPDARPAVSGRAPLLGQSPGQGSSSGPSGPGLQVSAPIVQAQGHPTGNPDPRTVQATTQRAGGESGSSGPSTSTPPPPSAAPAPTDAAARAAAASTSVNPAPTDATTSQRTGAATPNSPLPSSVRPAPTTQGPTPGATAPGMAGSTMPPLTGMAGQLAQALSQALQGSGLFYESHLRDFTFGHRSLAQVRAEPQAHAGQDATGRPGSTEPWQPRAGAEAPSGQSSQTGPQAQGGQPTQSGGQAGQPAQGHLPGQAYQAQQGASTQLSGALLALDPSTHLLVRQQLETLANQTFAWHGEAWPGTDMEWEVQRREQQGTDTHEDHWATRLKLDLPGLGEVQVRLSLSGSQLVMHLVAPEGATLMADHTDLLRQRLGIQGLQLSQLTISRVDSDSDSSL